MATDNQLKSIRGESPNRIPIRLGILPAAWMKHREALEEIAARHPVLFGASDDDRDYDAVGGTYVQGEHIDAWGCVWSNLKTGMESLVTGHPVPTRDAVHTMKIPDPGAGIPHGFMYLRLADLRGFDELMIDFAEEPPELRLLIDKVCDYNVQEARSHARSLSLPPKVVYFGDDLGMQDSLPVSPEKWRKYLKPCFEKIYAPVCSAGHYVYMHTDGHILEIIPDLVECGVAVLNPQIGANGLENLARECKGKVCVDLDLDRQMFPFWTPEEIDAHVREAVELLSDPKGGLWLTAEVGDDVPLDNVEAICCALEKYSIHFNV